MTVGADSLFNAVVDGAFLECQGRFWLEKNSRAMMFDSVRFVRFCEIFVKLCDS